MSMLIREIMSAPAMTCRQNDALETAARIMWDNDVGAIPVVDDNGGIVGMVTDRDACMAAFTQGRALREIPVSDAMAKAVFCCHADESLEAAEHLMSEQQIRRVPIVDGDNHPIGMLSLNDVARYAASMRKRNGLDREVTQTLAAICRPRPHAEQATQRPQPQL